MTSTSTSTDCKSFKYDVFLSFRGEDTRKNFVDHLYYALHQKSIHTYKDDERIEKGKRINDELVKSIEDSKLFIIVFSKNYASSSWCLDELVKIMEYHKTTDEKTAYPVFYDVKPSEVRKRIGAVGKAFAKHKDREAAQKRRDALKEASELAGWELKNIANGHEAKLIQQIVEEVSLELRSIDSSTDIIEMETGVTNNNETSLETGADQDDVRMMGMIKGFGDRVMTNLTTTVIDHISFEFAKEVSKASLSGLKSLQKLVQTGVTDNSETSLETEADQDDVRMMGMIKGLGDRVMTNLTTTVIDRISSEFAKEVSKASLSGLKSLQKLVHSDVRAKSRHQF